MSSASLNHPPDWFDTMWAETIAPKLPIWMRSETSKKMAREALSGIMDGLAQHAQTPAGAQQVLAFVKIAQIVKGAQGVLASPDPTPDEVAQAVQRLVERVKP